MNAHDLTAWRDAAVEAAQRGAAELEAWRGKFTIREKARADLVTDADTASQKAVKAYLLGRFPDHQFLGEEDCFGKSLEVLQQSLGSAPTWIVDPLDGTANYAHGLPCYAVNVALMVDGEIVVGVTFDPRLNEMFVAAKGGGTFLNGVPVRVSDVTGIRDGLIATGFPSNFDAQLRNLEAWKRVSYHAQGLRRTGSTAINMAYVAAGRFDGYWCYDNWPWDVAPGAILIHEAGGRVTSSDGTPFNPFRMDIIATNGHTHGELLLALQDDVGDVKG
ncbi:inositol monophosphatase family protein [Limnoglobus roseus]|nr:inositol monophosphatase family protein [Limnoglobus roseus]